MKLFESLDKCNKTFEKIFSKPIFVRSLPFFRTRGRDSESEECTNLTYSEVFILP